MDIWRKTLIQAEAYFGYFDHSAEGDSQNINNCTSYTDAPKPYTLSLENKAITANSRLCDLKAATQSNIKPDENIVPNKRILMISLKLYNVTAKFWEVLNSRFQLNHPIHAKVFRLFSCQLS